jgi:acylphosphatase
MNSKGLAGAGTAIPIENPCPCLNNKLLSKRMKHYNITITGRVQKIGFRFSAMQSAYRYGVHGFVRNTNDDKVYIEAEGEDGNLDGFLQWCNRGPMGAKVEKVEFTEGKLQNFKSFEIISGRG